MGPPDNTALREQSRQGSQANQTTIQIWSRHRTTCCCQTRLWNPLLIICLSRSEPPPMRMTHLFSMVAPETLTVLGLYAQSWTQMWGKSNARVMT